MAAARRHGLVAAGAAWDGGAARRTALLAAGARVVVTDPASVPTGPTACGT